MSHFAIIQLTRYQDEDKVFIDGSEGVLTQLLHRSFLDSPGFHRLCTEALLTFDTEAGGTPIDTTIPAPEPGKEGQP